MLNSFGGRHASQTFCGAEFFHHRPRPCREEIICEPVVGAVVQPQLCPGSSRQPETKCKRCCYTERKIRCLGTHVREVIIGAAGSLASQFPLVRLSQRTTWQSNWQKRATELGGASLLSRKNSCSNAGPAVMIFGKIAGQSRSPSGRTPSRNRKGGAGATGWTRVCSWGRRTEEET